MTNQRLLQNQNSSSESNAMPVLAIISRFCEMMGLEYSQEEVTELSENPFLLTVRIRDYNLWFTSESIKVTKQVRQRNEFSVRQMVGEYPRKELLEALLFVSDSVARDMRERCLRNI